MAGDGMSLQTTIVQLGNVAQTQLKGQQSHHPTTPFSDRLDANQNSSVQRVRKTEEAEPKRVDPDSERDRRRREHGAGERPAEPAIPVEGAAAEDPDGAPAVGEIGRNVDTRA